MMQIILANLYLYPPGSEAGRERYILAKSHALWDIFEPSFAPSI